MLLIEVKVFKDELTPEQTRALIQKITDAFTSVTSERLRGVTGGSSARSPAVIGG